MIRLYLQPKLIKKMKQLTPNELRVGNLLFDDNSDNIMEVSRIESTEHANWNSGNMYNVVCKKHNTIDKYYEGHFRPIPLIEEWLIKFGFEKENKSYCKNGLRLMAIRDLYFRGDFPIKADIQYVHQLQNLYFALTNEELKLND